MGVRVGADVGAGGVPALHADAASVTATSTANARSCMPADGTFASVTTLSGGDPAPAFALPDQEGRTVRLEDFRGRKLLVYFYPKALTSGCTAQSCAVRDAREDLSGLGVDAVGISPDAPGLQSKFDAKHSLGFPLLSDPDHAVAEAFGVWGEKSMYGRKYMGIVRSAFLIDERGRIQEAWYKVKPKDTVPNALAALR
jgi:thioredoxin-dependent peroxiredoxin